MAKNKWGTMTEQLHENLIYEGEDMTMPSCSSLPHDHPAIVQLSDEEFEYQFSDTILLSSACWRGYIATWEIKKNQLYLIAVKGRYQMDGAEPIFADWFSGILRIPKGERLKNKALGLLSAHELELHIKINQGMVTKSEVIGSREKEYNE